MPRRVGSEHPRVALIQRKLAPPPPPAPLVERPRLEQLLEALFERHRVVVVSATAGAGKTTAVAAAARRLTWPLAWLSVDRTDAAPGRLVTYLEAALARTRPELAGLASEALAAGIPHAEAVGLLIEAAGDAPLLIVLDDLERLGDAPEALAVIEALLRYAPPAVHVALISRRDVPSVLSVPSGHVSATISEGDLAFTVTEAAEALELLGERETDAAEVVAATGGWVTGVLFEAWRSAAHVAGLGGEADPLDGYLSSQLLEQLDPAARDFLVATSVLEEVTVARATALGQPAAAERVLALRAAHLPVVWGEGGTSMRCHPRFRDYLLARLERRGPDAVREVRVAHGRLLAREGHHEEATEVLLRAGADEQALTSAEQAIFPVIERLDGAVAERWLTALADVAPSGATQLTIAELALSLTGDDYRRGVRVADQLVELDERERLAHASDRAAGLMASLYAGVGRLDDAHAVLDAASGGLGASTVRYMLRMYEGGPAQPRPEPGGEEADGVLSYADYFCGRLDKLGEAPLSRWAYAVARPWQIAARAALGHTAEALELYEAAQDAGVMTVSLAVCPGPEVLMDAGRLEQARALIAHGRRLARATGALDLECVNRLMEGKLALRLERDPEAARAVLEQLERDLEPHAWPFLIGPINAWLGAALLLQGDDVAALARLSRAVEVLVDADLILELPTAAGYLAEAQWRAGDEEAADRAADLALDASHRLGSNHRLLQALTDYPAVVSRRIDAEQGADSAWHELGRALIAQGAGGLSVIGSVVELREFGEPALAIAGATVRARIAKSYELVAFLIVRGGDGVDRDELLDALFDGRADDSARSYLRQAIYWVRRALPEGGLLVEKRRVRLGAELTVSSESTTFEARLAEAARLQGEERLAATRAALELYDRGEYLAGAASGWVAARREQLAERALDARYEAAELAFAAGAYGDGRALAEQVLGADPLREAAWRLLMRIASALGDEDRVIATFRDCERALATIGTAPSAVTRELVERLRR
ncbi:BTAD domain-containing putative transcriptional regulator [Conexibacter woesei]|uniref:Transcriptional activator domain protein n=1 Tax=Conexibacter woesei (strain DSM 14684 / CCUG 47730 / CIP 108061 / JCM 11494 / NBRC 100937 / ID131577) TaxID=469383 RepID=D3F3P8_CONWI|nr:BTAD domain-containing putative transcriptional regulator [Conexibacter woesei]ADB52413.1 transcriptional activator domain protein [Conexibacter woesei DSM 14684]